MKVLAGRRRGAPRNGGPRPEQRGGTSPQSFVLALQRSAGNRVVTTLIARSPTLKGGAKLDSLENITKHAEATYKAYTEYCATKLLAEYVTTWAEDAAWAYIEEANGEVTLEELLSALKQRFDEMLAGIPPEQKASEQKPAAVPKPQPRLPYGTSAPAPAPTAPGPLVARPAPWGILWLVWPGIGVEDPNKDESYARFLREQLEIIAQTQVGAALLAEFDPVSGSSFRMLAPVGKEKEDPYAGITALIGEPLSPKLEIRTVDVGELKGPQGEREKPKLTIPRISFFSRPADKQEKLIASGPSKFVHTGLASHKDFPSTVEPFDVVLFHEFGHAFLSQTGYSKLLDDPQEEKVVVGLLETKGLVSSENAYRCQKGRALRPSYIDSGHQPDPELDPTKAPERFWQDQRIGLRQAVAKVLHLSEEQVEKKLKES